MYQRRAKRLKTQKNKRRYKYNVITYYTDYLFSLNWFLVSSLAYTLQIW